MDRHGSICDCQEKVRGFLTRGDHKRASHMHFARSLWRLGALEKDAVRPGVRI